MKSLLLAFLFVQAVSNAQPFTRSFGAIVRCDSTEKRLALVFTADEYGEGLQVIAQTLKRQNLKAGFFFTGRFYRNRRFQQHILRLRREGHYLGPHSDEHLLYCDWTKRDSLLVTRDSFEKDMAKNLQAMRSLDVNIEKPHPFIPPFEWWNDSIALWSQANGLRLFNFSPGMRTAADYTWPEMGAGYKSSQWLLDWLKETIVTAPQRLNGSILLVHAGTDPRRKDKLYNRLGEMISSLKAKGFSLVRIDDLLKP